MAAGSSSSNTADPSLCTIYSAKNHIITEQIQDSKGLSLCRQAKTLSGEGLFDLEHFAEAAFA